MILGRPLLTRMMKCSFLFVLCCLSCRHEVAAQPDVKMFRVQDTTTRDASGWYLATATEGHFSVAMPIPFNDFTISDKDTNGASIRMFVIGSKSAEGIKLTVTEAPFMKEGIDPDLDALAHSFNGNGNRISALKKESWQGHPSVYFRLAGPKSGACIRYVKTAHRLITQIWNFLKPTKVKRMLARRGSSLRCS